MKKLAYTLAEVLITLSIIGIIAAVAAPAITSAKPDVSKIQYLKVYDHLTQIAQELAGNPQIFAPIFYSNNRIDCNEASNVYNVSSVPLINICASSDGRFSSFSGYTKFGHILAEVMGGTDVTEGNINNISNNFVAFTTPDNMNWRVTYRRFAAGAARRGFYNVMVDVNGDEGPNDSFRAYFNNISTRPDQFIFYISASGIVYPADQCGQMYRDTRLTTTSRRRYQELINEGNYPDQDNFDFGLVNIDYDNDAPQIN